MTQRQLADAAGVGEKAVNHVETGGAVPTREVFAAVCAVLGLDADALIPAEQLGRSRVALDAMRKLDAEVGAELQRARKARGISQRTASESVRVVLNTMRNWEHGRSQITRGHAVALCDLYGIEGERREAIVAHARPDKTMARRPMQKVDPVDTTPEYEKVPAPQIARGTIWRRADGRTVVIEAHAYHGDVVRYRPLPEGDMMRLGWETFRAKYRQVLS